MGHRHFCGLDRTGARADVWLAAQCLAAGGGASLPIIQTLLSRLFGSDVERDQGQATTLLANISSKTVCTFCLFLLLLSEDVSLPWLNALELICVFV